MWELTRTDIDSPKGEVRPLQIMRYHGDEMRDWRVPLLRSVHELNRDVCKVFRDEWRVASGSSDEPSTTRTCACWHDVIGALRIAHC